MGRKKLLTGFLTAALLLLMGSASLTGVMGADIPEVQREENSQTVPGNKFPGEAASNSLKLSETELLHNGICGEEVVWSLNQEGVLTISGSGPMFQYDDEGNNFAPWYTYHANIKSVVIQDGVTSIGGYAFYKCENLAMVSIAESVTEIGWAAFENCISLTSIVIPDSVTGIGGAVFCNCSSLTDVVLPENYELSFYMFEGCSSLKKIQIPEGTVCIPAYAFCDCSSLSEIAIPENVTVIDQGAFYGCTGLMNVSIPENVTTIGWGAFGGCTGLKSITIPGNVTEIGERAFSGCTGLKSMTIPGNVTYIPNEAFSGCTGLTDVTILDGVEAIGSRAFLGCDNLSSLTIGGDVILNEDSFYYVSSLTNLTILEGTTKIDTGLRPLYYLKNITIPKSVTSIEDEGIFYFYDTVIHGYAGTAAETWALHMGLTFSPITVSDSASGSTETVSGICGTKLNWTLDKTGTLTISGTGDMDSYDRWNYTFAPWVSRRFDVKTVVIEDGVTSIGAGAFQGCNNLTNIVIPDSIIAIGCEAFLLCDSLENIVIPDSVKSMEHSIFRMCVSLREISLPKNLPCIPEDSFMGCNGLANIVIPNGVTSIEQAAFYGCNGLTSITIPDSVTNIGEHVFFECSEELTIFCGKNSYAAEYAAANNIRYQYIKKREQNITASDIIRTFGDTAFSLNAATDGNGTLTYMSDNPSVAVVDNNGIVTLISAGTVHITITASETDTYQAAEKVITITVNPAETASETPSEDPEENKQTITAKNIIKTYGDKPFSLSAKTNGGGKLTYKISNTKIATIDKKGKVTIKGCGQTQIKITAAANGNYQKATKTITLTVKPKKTTVTSVKSTKSKALTVKWKQDKKAKGYIIEYSTDKKFKKNVKTVTISKNSTVSKTFTKLKGGKKYYVRVCAYTTADGKKIKGSYSKVMSIKVKK